MMKPSREQLKRLIELINATADNECDCDAFLERVAPYLESLEKGQSLPPELRVIEQHLRVCAECHEEFQALLAARDLT